MSKKPDLTSMKGKLAILNRRIDDNLGEVKLLQDQTSKMLEERRKLARTIEDIEMPHVEVTPEALQDYMQLYFKDTLEKIYKSIRWDLKDAKVTADQEVCVKAVGGLGVYTVYNGVVLSVDAAEKEESK